MTWDSSHRSISRRHPIRVSTEVTRIIITPAIVIIVLRLSTKLSALRGRRGRRQMGHDSILRRVKKRSWGSTRHGWWWSAIVIEVRRWMEGSEPEGASILIVGCGEIRWWIWWWRRWWWWKCCYHRLLLLLIFWRSVWWWLYSLGWLFSWWAPIFPSPVVALWLPSFTRLIVSLRTLHKCY